MEFASLEDLNVKYLHFTVQNAFVDVFIWYFWYLTFLIAVHHSWRFGGLSRRCLCYVRLTAKLLNSTPILFFLFMDVQYQKIVSGRFFGIFKVSTLRRILSFSDENARFAKNIQYIRAD